VRNKFFLNELVQKSCAMYVRGRVYEGGPPPPLVRALMLPITKENFSLNQVLRVELTEVFNVPWIG
jgi:hypothetical protein